MPSYGVGPHAAIVGRCRFVLSCAASCWGLAMASMTETAWAFFEACETGKGWAGCRAYCAPAATFSAQAEPLEGIVTLEAYAEWMKGLLTVLTDGHYSLKSFAIDEERQSVCAYAVFTGTHLAGGPCPATGKTAHADYVYIMQFKDSLIVHMDKVWHSGITLKQLGWA